MNNHENPLVSIIIITYNDEKNILESLNSALNQSYKNIEVIVVDDGSSDNTSILLKDYEYKIKYIYQNNSGIGTARAMGFNNSRGKYIQFLDSDDILPNDKIEWQLNYLEHNNKISFVYGVTKCFYYSDKLENAWDHPNQKKAISGNLLEEIIYNGNFINIGQPLFLKESIIKAGGCDDKIKGSDDQDLMIRLALTGALAAFCNKTSYYYRHVPNIKNKKPIARHNNLHRYEGELRAWKKMQNALKNKEFLKVVNIRISKIYYKISRTYYKDFNTDEAIIFLKKSYQLDKNLIKYLIFYFLYKYINYNLIKKLI